LLTSTHTTDLAASAPTTIGDCFFGASSAIIRRCCCFSSARSRRPPVLPLLRWPLLLMVAAGEAGTEL
jgi:hypothetical protein